MSLYEACTSVQSLDDRKRLRDLIMDKRRENFGVDQTIYPHEYTGLSPKGILNIYDHCLSPFEKIEVQKYQRIYCISMNKDKLQAPVDALEKYYFGGINYNLTTGDHIDYRYQIDEVIGNGDYGLVGAATDCKTKRKVAIKMVSISAPKIYGDADMRLHIQSVDTESQSNFVRMLDYNEFRGYHYIVMDLYDTDLKKYIKEHAPNGIELKNIQKMGRSIILALDFLARHNIIHSDLKPENLMLNMLNPNHLKLGDFTLARFVPERICDILKCQTLFYRAPEVFVWGRQTCAIDIWSFGCVLAEMVTGKIFLKGMNSWDQFYLIQEVLNIPPDDFIKRFTCGQFFFSSFRTTTPKHVTGDDLNVCHIYTCAAPHRKIPGSTPIGSFFDKPEQKTFKDVILRIFKWMPERRPTPSQLWDHQFFSPTGIPGYSGRPESQPVSQEEWPDC